MTGRRIAGLDIVVAPTDSETSYSPVEDDAYSAGTLSATMTRTFPVAGPARRRTVLVSGGASAAPGVLTFGTDGAAACALGPC